MHLLLEGWLILSTARFLTSLKEHHLNLLDDESNGCAKKMDGLYSEVSLNSIFLVFTFVYSNRQMFTPNAQLQVRDLLPKHVLTIHGSPQWTKDHHKVCD